MRRLLLIAVLASLGGCALLDDSRLTEAERMQRAQMGLQLMQMARPQAMPAPAPAFRQPVYCRTVWTGFEYRTVCD